MCKYGMPHQSVIDMSLQIISGHCRHSAKIAYVLSQWKPILFMPTTDLLYIRPTSDHLSNISCNILETENSTFYISCMSCYPVSLGIPDPVVGASMGDLGRELFWV